MRVVVFCPNWVGDVVMATPTFRALRKQFAGAELVGVLRPHLFEVLEGTTWFDRYLFHGPRRRVPAVPGGGKGGVPAGCCRGWTFVRKLRQEEFDLGVLLTNSWRSAAMAWLGGVRRRVGYRREGRGWVLTDALEPQRASRRFAPSPVVDYYLALAYHLGCARETYRLELATTPREEAAADELWRRFGLDQADRVVALNPGGAYGSAKHWPAEYFAELAQRLVREQSAAVLVLCGPQERAMARSIAEQAGHPRVASLADEEVGLGLTKSCVRRADLLITTDSGPRHFAAAFDVPEVTIFGPTHQAWSYTYYERAVHLQKQVPCGPCQQRVCPLDHRCMRELGPGEVYAGAAELLGRYAGRAIAAARARSV